VVEYVNQGNRLTEVMVEYVNIRGVKLVVIEIVAPINAVFTSKIG